MTDFVVEKQDDFIALLMRLINAGKQDEAIQEILNLDGPVAQLEVLERLTANSARFQLRFELAVGIGLARTRTRARVHDLAHDLDFALGRARDLDRALYPSLGRALDFTCEVAHALALNRAHARDLDLTHTRAHTLARDLDFALDLAHARARVLARDPAYRFSDMMGMALNLSRLSDLAESLVFLLFRDAIPSRVMNRLSDDYFQHMANTLDTGLFLYQQNPSPLLDTITQVLDHIVGDDLRYFTLEGAAPITPDVLANQIAPYVQALRDVKEVFFTITKTISEDKNLEYEEPRIVQIHNESPKIEIIGVADVIRAVNETFSFRKRKQDAEQRDLQNEKERLENELLQIQKQREQAETEAQIRQIKIEDDKQLSVQEKEIKIALQREELRKQQLENEDRELALEERRWNFEKEQMREYIAMATELLQRKFGAQNVSMDIFVEHVPKLARALKRMDESGLTLRIGWHDVPRPSTLPEGDKDE